MEDIEDIDYKKYKQHLEDKKYTGTKNVNLNKAKALKDDEFYTLYEDIEKEVQDYQDQFKDKIVYLNCDDPEFSNFWKYFSNNFDNLKLKKLISTHYKSNGCSYKLEKTKEKIEKTDLEMNGDFRNGECIDILKDSDIIVTNPPFSLFRDYLKQLMRYRKTFLIVGPLSVVGYKPSFKAIKENRMWLGKNFIKGFKQPNGNIKRFGNICWFTNLKSTVNEFITLDKNYSEEVYKKFDNYNAINIDKLKDIPKDYYHPMGVPVTFLEKYNPEQFEIIGTSSFSCKYHYGVGTLRFNKKEKYTRIIIKRINK